MTVPFQLSAEAPISYLRYLHWRKLEPKTATDKYIYIYIYISEVGGSETNREIDFGFGSCVRARALDVRWEFGISSSVIFPFSLFAHLVPAAFPFSLGDE